jgi:hypothetical protein
MQKYGKKNDFTFKSIFVYSPQKDKGLSTPKKEVMCKQVKVDGSLLLVKKKLHVTMQKF